MATIRNSISLQDRMTPVFRSIIKSMDSTLRVMRNLDRQANNGVQSRAYRTAERDIRRANNELIRMQNNLDRADRNANNLASTTSRISSNMMTMRSGGFNLSNLASGLYLLKNIASVVSDLMDTPDTMNAIQYRMETYDTTDATGNQLFDAAYIAAMRSRSDIESTGNLASRILVSGAVDGNGAEAIDLAELLNKASFLGGSSAQESQRALLQLSQALASGVLQGDELRAIREQAPGLTDTLAKGLSSLAEKGVLPEKFLGTTMGDLKALGADGELTAERVMAAFREMGDYVDTTFENSPKQFGQAITGIANVWKRWLKIMSQGDNAFAKINEAAWKLLEWLNSDSGYAFLEGLANALNIIVDAIFMAINWVGQLIEWFNNLENSSELLQAAILTLSFVVVAAAVYMATQWIIAWVAAAWPVLLVIALVGALIYALLAMGVSAGQIVGAVVGAFWFLMFAVYTGMVWIVNILYWAIAIIWDAIVGLILVIIDIIMGACIIIMEVIAAIVQLILWVITTIWSALVTIYDVVYTIIKGAWGIIKGAIVAVYGLFVGLGEGVLGILYGIASAIDAIFGSNLAGAVGGWMDGLGKSLEDLNNALDPLGEYEDIGNQWSSSFSDLGNMYAGNGEFDDWNITDNMTDIWNDGFGAVDDVNQFTAGLMLDPAALNDWTFDNTVNPMDGWNLGFDMGNDLVSGLEGLSGLDIGLGLTDISSIEDMMNNIGTDGLEISGGSLDSIKSDVDISDEDIQLLRDMAAREFLLNLQTVTPTANISFGDVRETADVNKIIDVLQDMVDEQLATNLVVN